jgi:YjbE family integral membrane protein
MAATAAMMGIIAHRAHLGPQFRRCRTEAEGGSLGMLEQLLGPLQAALADYGPTAVRILQIIWINALLSGDNAVVIALACRSLSQRQQRWGIVFGAGAAVLLRIFFIVVLQYVLELAYLRLVGGMLLIYIAVKLMLQDTVDKERIESADNLWDAVKTIAIADIVMSLDNVLAIAAVASGQPWLIAFGLVLSIPLIIAGATMIMALLTRLPILVWAGAALLGWIAGELVTQDPAGKLWLTSYGDRFGLSHGQMETAIQAGCLLFVVVCGIVLMKWRGRRQKQPRRRNRAAK